MPQYYSDPSREADPHALPDLEVFAITDADRVSDLTGPTDENETEYAPGWYYWYAMPGCLPDSDPIGPFPSEADALIAARADAGDQS